MGDVNGISVYHVVSVLIGGEWIDVFPGSFSLLGSVTITADGLAVTRSEPWVEFAALGPDGIVAAPFTAIQALRYDDS